MDVHTDSQTPIRIGRPPIHGLSKTPEFRTWTSMMTRCRNPRSQDYPRYGGRGIIVCERWNTFVNFLADMGHKPSRRHSIDRINTNGNYEPSNCRWATPIQQSRNQRSNRVIELNGRSQCVADWAEEYGMAPDTLRHRLDRGFSLEESLEMPVILPGDRIREAAKQRFHCKHGHEYTTANTLITTEGARKCRTCSKNQKFTTSLNRRLSLMEAGPCSF